MAEIKFENVNKVFSGEAIALENVNLEIYQGEFVFFIGRSGAGKSTVLRLLSGQMPVTSGEIYVNDKKVSALNKYQLPYFRRQFGLMEPGIGLISSRTVQDNVAIAMYVTEQKIRGMKKRVMQALGEVGMQSKADFYPNQLSGGEIAKVQLARALSTRPRILIADEPTANLDPDNSWDLMCLLDEVNRAGVTVLVASHDRELVTIMRKRVVTLSAGVVVADERRAIYNSMASDILEERRVLNERAERALL